MTKVTNQATLHWHRYPQLPLQQSFGTGPSYDINDPTSVNTLGNQVAILVS